MRVRHEWYDNYFVFCLSRYREYLSRISHYDTLASHPVICDCATD